VYCRREDAPTVHKIVVRDGFAAISKEENNTSGNPSRRRDGLAVRFWCEQCGSVSELTIAQIKGASFVGWRILRRGNEHINECA
jgi:hypothetical protein